VQNEKKRLFDGKRKGDGGFRQSGTDMVNHLRAIRGLKKSIRRLVGIPIKRMNVWSNRNKKKIETRGTGARTGKNRHCLIKPGLKTQDLFGAGGGDGRVKGVHKSVVKKKSKISERG